MKQALASFIVNTRAGPRTELTRFIKDEFAACLKCGILVQGFLRLRCGECSRDKLLAISCKRPEFCPSCLTRRMSQAIAHLARRGARCLEAARTVDDQGPSGALGRGAGVLSS